MKRTSLSLAFILSDPGMLHGQGHPYAYGCPFIEHRVKLGHLRDKAAFDWIELMIRIVRLTTS